MVSCSFCYCDRCIFCETEFFTVKCLRTSPVDLILGENRKSFGGDSMIRCAICNRVEQEDEKPFVVVASDKKLCPDCLKKIGSMAGYVYNNMYPSMEPIRESADRSWVGDSSGNTVYAKINGRLTPHRIKEALDRFVVGQEDAKIALSIASYNHWKRQAMGDPSIQKSNILLMGPTGCGKTHLVKTLGRILNVPVSVTPATSLTEAGYVGNDAESVVANLFFAAGQDVRKAERGIIFIDEIDKLVSNASGARKEVGGTGVQQALLPILEGAKVEVALSGKSKMSPSSTASVMIDTTNILFICGGAFPALGDIVRSRLTHHARVGFVAEDQDSHELSENENFLRLATTEDLQAFGLIPEFIGRVPVREALEPLSVDTLRRILTDPEDSIVRQYQKLFAFDEIDLEFEDAALDYLAEKASACGTGARALRGVMEEALEHVMYDAPSAGNLERIIITREFVSGKTEEPDTVYGGRMCFGKRCGAS